MTILYELLFDYTLRTVALGAAVLGILSGALGSFAVLRKQSLLGDAISHAALPGVAIAFIITLTKNPLALLLGAAITGWIGTLFMMLVTKTTRIKEDAAMGIVLSVFFGFGIVLLTYIQKLPTASQSGLSTFLFGNASTIIQSDVIIMAVIGIISLFLLFLLWKEFKILSFDPDYGQTIGFPMRAIEICLTTLIVIAIVVGLQTVGVVLMSAMIIAPASAARQWTDKLGMMVLIASLFGVLSGVTGAVTSSLVPNLPTGPTIVLAISVIVGISLALAPHRGIVWEWIRAKSHRRKINIARTLMIMHRLTESHTVPRPHEIAALQELLPTNIHKTLRICNRMGWVLLDRTRWMLTSQGIKEAIRIEREGFS
ncbi:MAG TPA: metal ABC transporter permease [Candidatus Nanoarchaeia archaeon]|nr:metal ABC transporter permease [Candidatus Nanoarchaeia archaeon]